MITSLHLFKLIKESSDVEVKIFSRDKLRNYLFDFDKHTYKDPTIFKRIRFFSESDLWNYDKEPKDTYYTVLFKENYIIGLAKIDFYSTSAPNKNTLSIAFFSIDKNFRGHKYSRLMANELFKEAKKRNKEIQTSSYTVLGKEYLQHLFNEYAKKHSVIFHDKSKEESLHDAEWMYKTVNGKKLHHSELESFKILTSIKSFKLFKEANEYSDYIQKIVTKELGDLDDVEYRIQSTNKLVDEIKSLPQIFIAYRLYQLNYDETINYTNLGSHFIIDRSIINNNWLNSIGNLNKDKLVLLSVEINKDDVNWYRTIYQNAHYPDEKEVYVSDKASVKAIKEETINI